MSLNIVYVFDCGFNVGLLEKTDHTSQDLNYESKPTIKKFGFKSVERQSAVRWKKSQQVPHQIHMLVGLFCYPDLKATFNYR